MISVVSNFPRDELGFGGFPQGSWLDSPSICKPPTLSQMVIYHSLLLPQKNRLRLSNNLYKIQANNYANESMMILDY